MDATVRSSCLSSMRALNIGGFRLRSGKRGGARPPPVKLNDARIPRAASASASPCCIGTRERLDRVLGCAREHELAVFHIELLDGNRDIVARHAEELVRRDDRE